MCIRSVTYMCRKGHFYSEQPPPGIQSNTGWCHPCSHGSFMDSEEHNERKCRLCRKCDGGPNEYYQRQCDQIADSECAFCPPGLLASPDGRCQSPTTKALADTTTTSASSTNAEITATTALVASATSSASREALTSNDSTHSEQVQLSQAATKDSVNDGGMNLLRSSQWRSYNQTNASTAQEDDGSLSIVTLTTASSSVVVEDSLKAATPFSVTADGIHLDARVTALAVMSVTSTVTLVALVAFWLKRRERVRHGSCSSQLSCYSCVLSSHVYEEPYEYDATYLEAPSQSDSDRSSTAAASYGEGHTYDYARPYGSSCSSGNSSANSSLLNGRRGSPAERLLCQLPASESEMRPSGKTDCTLSHSTGEFIQVPLEVTHLRCGIETVLNGASCNANSHSTGKLQ